MNRQSFFTDTNINLSIANPRGSEIVEWLKEYFLPSWDRNKLTVYFHLLKYPEKIHEDPGYGSIMGRIISIAPRGINERMIEWLVNIEMLGEPEQSFFKFKASDKMYKNNELDSFKIDYIMSVKNEADILTAITVCEAIIESLPL